MLAADCKRQLILVGRPRAVVGLYVQNNSWMRYPSRDAVCAYDVNAERCKSSHRAGVVTAFDQYMIVVIDRTYVIPNCPARLAATERQCIQWLWTSFVELP